MSPSKRPKPRDRSARLGGGRSTQRPAKATASRHEAPGDVLERTARRAGLSAEALLAHLLSQNKAPGEVGAPCLTRTDVQRLLLACERLGLDPLSGEAYLSGLPGLPGAPAQVLVGLCGWLRLLNEHPAVCGIEFQEGPKAADGGGLPEWVSCTIHRSDRPVPTTVREYMDESRGTAGAWLTHPRRMLRHCALVQCARVAIGPGGASQEDAGWPVSHESAQRAMIPPRPQAPQGPQELVASIRGRQGAPTTDD